MGLSVASLLWLFEFNIILFDKARLQAAKAKHGTGKLGKKLEEDRQKNRTTLLNEAAAQKEQDKQQPLVFD